MFAQDKTVHRPKSRVSAHVIIICAKNYRTDWESRKQWSIVIGQQIRTKNKGEKVIEVTWSPSGSHLCTQSIRELGGGGGAQVAYTQHGDRRRRRRQFKCAKPNRLFSYSVDGFFFGDK